MNRVAMITGASRGLGKTLASFLAAQGYALILSARHNAALEAATQEMRRFGGRVIAVPGDVSNPGHRHALVEAALSLGRLDLLVNNASILGASPLPPLTSYPIETLEQILAVNTLAPLALIQDLIELLKLSAGLVVNISSDAAAGGYPGWGGYGASKAALDLITLTLARESDDRRLAFVSVDPGDMRTQMHQDAFPGEDISDRPRPEVTIPFWAWLLGQEHATIHGQRFQAQSEIWTTANG